MRLLLLICGIVAGLSGCTSEMPAKGEELAKLKATCSGYGFRQGSSEFSACLMHLDDNRIAENRARRRAFGEALSDAGDQMQANARNQELVNAMNRPVSCTSTGYANTVRTNCY